MIVVTKKTWIEGWWHVQCSVILGDGTRVGVHSVELPEDATDAQIEAAVLALYQG